MIASPSGRAIAFFDLDETLIACKSIFDFLVFLDNHIPEPRSKEVFGEIQRLRTKGIPREILNPHFWRLAFAGVKRDTVIQASELWFRQRKEETSSFFIQSTRERLEWHRSVGHEIVLISGSSGEIVSPIAHDLQIEHAFSSELSVEEGLFTGELVGSAMIGRRKAEVAAEFTLKAGLNITSCFAYGDHISDLPLLESVGFPFVVGSDVELGLIAKHRNWPTLVA